MPGAINEVLRIESPIQVFSRYLVRDAEVEGVRLPQGSRALVMYGSANRDEGKWQDPERFDIRRKAAEQLAFGHGEHLCVGLPLARLEIRALLAALARRVQRFEIQHLRRGINNTLRGLAELQVSVQ
jgi:cytochrome P450